MRSVEVIKESRDKILASIDRIRTEQRKLREKYDSTAQMNSDERLRYLHLRDMLKHYYGQINALNFVLNEDSELDNLHKYAMFKSQKHLMF